MGGEERKINGEESGLMYVCCMSVCAWEGAVRIITRASGVDQGKSDKRKMYDKAPRLPLDSALARCRRLFVSGSGPVLPTLTQHGGSSLCQARQVGKGR